MFKGVADFFNFPTGFNPLVGTRSKHSRGGLSTEAKAAKARKQRQKMKQHKRRFHLK